MELAKEYILKALQSCQRALNDLEKGNEHGIRLALGDCDYIEDRIQAVKILLREELKELNGN
jgi:hypothetical protein